jgi:hypothetical protein
MGVAATPPESGEDFMRQAFAVRRLALPAWALVAATALFFALAAEPAAAQSAVSQEAWSRLPDDGKAACPQTPTSRMTLREDPALTVDDSMSERELAAISQDKNLAAKPDDAPEGPATSSEADLEMGFYTAEPHVLTRSPLLLVSSPSGGYAVCVPAISVTFTLGASIFISRELAPGSCPRDEILRHEQIHHEIDLYAMKQLQRELPIIALNFPTVFWGATPQQAREGAKAAQQQLSNLLQRRFAEIRTPLQRAHDSPEEYRRLTLSCNGETRRVGIAAAKGQTLAPTADAPGN